MFKESINKFEKNWSVFLPLSYLVFTLFYIFFFTDSNYFKDEHFFMRGAREFSTLSLSTYLDHLKSYYPPQAPLIHTIAGLIYQEGISIKVFRVINAIFSFFTLLCFFDLLKKSFKRESFKILMLCSCLVVLNPYFFLISAYYYADGLYLLLTSICFRFYFLNKESKFYLASLLAPLSRQFGLFISTGSLLVNLFERKEGWKKRALYSLFCLAPIILLFIYWEGFQPSTGFSSKANLVSEKHGPIIISYAVYYLSALGFYLLPINLIGIKVFIKDKYFYIGAFIGLLLFCIFPPVENFYLGLPLGLYHKTLLKMGFFGSILMAALCSIYAGRCALYIKSKSIPLIIKIWITLMFGIATFSPVCWDKYILDLILLNIIGFLFWRRGSSTSKEVL